MTVSAISPVLGNWYRHLDKGFEFQVVAVDEFGGVVDIQHYDGDVEELELDDWNAMHLELIEPPEEWAGPIDDVEHDDMGYSETDMTEDDWNSELGEWHQSESEEEREMSDIDKSLPWDELKEKD